MVQFFDRNEGYWEFNTSRKNIYQNSYSETSSRMTGFLRLMSHWRGSVIKQIYHNIIVFLALYFFLRFYFINDPYQRQMFEVVCVFFDRYSEYIPLSFLVGFYVQQVVSRWWDMFTSLPFPDRLALKLVSYCAGKDSFKKNLRRTIMRYVNVSTILVYRLVSRKVLNKFPNMDSLVENKLLLVHEAKRLSKIDNKRAHESTWVPILWALKLLQKAREEEKVKIEAPVYANLVSSFEYIEHANRRILNYGWVEFPLAYTQVATGSVYAYFFAALLGKQFLQPPDSLSDTTTFNLTNVAYSHENPYDQHTPDIIFPFFTVVEFICYMGWIKIAENLLNPFGDDDNDIDINYLIDRNLQVSYMIVDDADTDMEMTDRCPFLEAGISIPEDLTTKQVGVRSRQNSVRSNIGRKITAVLSRSTSRATIAKEDTDSISHGAPSQNNTMQVPAQYSRQNSLVSNYYSPNLQQRQTNMSVVSEESDTQHSNGSLHSGAASTLQAVNHQLWQDLCNSADNQGATKNTLTVTDPWLGQEDTADTAGECNYAFEEETNVRL